VSHDLLRSAEKATLTVLKADAPLTALVAKTSIEPMPNTAGVNADGSNKWPFVRLDVTQSIPQGRGCTARASVGFIVHSFGKAAVNGSGQITKTARDVAGDINSAVVEALHGHAYAVNGKRYRFRVTSSQLMQDGAEADAYHGFANVAVVVYDDV